MLPILIEAVKEQQAQIEILKAEVAALKASKHAALPAGVEASSKIGR